MVASSHVVVVTNPRGVGSSSSTGIDNMILAHGDTSPSSASTSSVIRSTSFSKIHLHHGKESTVASFNLPRRRMQAGLPPKAFPSPNDKSTNLRRIQSDNLAQSKRDDPSVRRSIFGHYFKEKPRSLSAPHIERTQSPPPIPSIQQYSPRPSGKRSSLPAGSPLPSPLTSRKNANHVDDYRYRRHQIRDELSFEVQPVDYRVFAPSEEQVAESAICSRYQELNREHQKDYDSLVERQVQVEHSLPPFPSPLIRFCSETTATAAGSDSYSAHRNNDSKRGNANFFPSSDGEMHYHGVYSLMTPCSIMKPSRYTNKVSTNTTNESPTSIDPNNIATPVDLEEANNYLSAPMTTSFNFPRSYNENAGIFKNFSDFKAAGADTPSSIDIGGEEEKKESDNAFLTSSPTQDIILLENKVMGDDSSLSTNITSVTSDDNDSQDKPANRRGLHQNRHLRFDPRVTVTEFEDSVPRKWYDESELNQHKREAIVLAQAYLRSHPAVAGWYRRAILDPVTKTHRKRALFSLPVFSSTYSSSDTEPCMDTRSNNNLEDCQTKPTHDSSHRDDDQVPVKRILVVHPSPNIASLFCKSMKSMFPSAELVSAGSSEEAWRLIQQSSMDSAGFDIMIIEQRLTPQGTPTNGSKNGSNKWDEILNNLDKGPLEIWDIMTRKNEEEEESSPTSSPTINDVRWGSDLIHQVCESTTDSAASSSSSCLIVGVSVRPERDERAMMVAGADVMWGIPIPRVGDLLRDRLLTMLLAKRSSKSCSNSSEDN